MKTLPKLILLGIVVVTTGRCATATLTPEGEAVKVVSDRKAIENCKLLGVVETEKSFSGGEMLYVLRNKAAALGADTLLVPRGAGIAGGAMAVRSGNAYSCGSK